MGVHDHNLGVHDVIPLFTPHQNKRSRSSESAVTVSAATKTVIIKVEGMTCGGCAVTVEKALKKTPGVEDAKVSYEKGEAWVKYDDAKVTLAKLREVINNTGFKAGEAKEEQ